jgi:hypothetical protein
LSDCCAIRLSMGSGIAEFEREEEDIIVHSRLLYI